MQNCSVIGLKEGEALFRIDVYDDDTKELSPFALYLDGGLE